MSRTVSFRASEELDEFLEQEAERRMTTKSTVAQMLLAERVRELQDERAGDVEGDGSEPAESGHVEGELPNIFGRHDEHWYRPDSEEHDFAVRVPGDTGTKYYKTQEGAAERLRKEYGE